MARHPAAATWVPFAALCLLAGLGAVATRQAPDRPAARLHRASQGFCAAVSAGDLEAAVRYVQPGPRAVRRLVEVFAVLRGLPWLVVEVDARRGHAYVVWGRATTPDRGSPQSRLTWSEQPDGRWKLAL